MNSGTPGTPAIPSFYDYQQESQRPQILDGIADLYDRLRRVTALDREPIAIAVFLEHSQQLRKIGSAATEFHFDAVSTGQVVHSVNRVNVSDVSTDNADKLSGRIALHDESGRMQVERYRTFWQLGNKTRQYVGGRRTLHCQSNSQAIAQAGQTLQCVNDRRSFLGVILLRQCAKISDQKSRPQPRCELHCCPRRLQARLQIDRIGIASTRRKRDRGNPQIQIIQHFPQLTEACVR